MRKITVSIIIVHYKHKKRLFNCLKSIKNNRPKTSFEVIVVDNDEKPTIEEELKNKFGWVKYIESLGNIGYGAGNNLGVKYAKGQFIFILNPDTEVLANSIDKLVDFLRKNKKVALVAPNLIKKNGEIFAQLGSRELTPLRGIVALSFLNKIFPRNPISKKYWLKDLPMDKERKVDVVPGSAFLIRRGIFEKLKGFDENFFLYFEESDFCRRVRSLGFDIYIIPDAEIIHYWKPGKPDTKKAKKIFMQSRFYYFRKYYGLLSALVVEFFARFSKWHALIFLVVLVGFLLYLLK